ncbi:hypothetical protein ACTMU2_32680 [Cupriavidus basilensis]
MVDDILDVTADTATLGKTAGKDAAHDKPTYVSLMRTGGGARTGCRTTRIRARGAGRLWRTGGPPAADPG